MEKPLIKERHQNIQLRCVGTFHSMVFFFSKSMVGSIFACFEIEISEIIKNQIMH